MLGITPKTKADQEKLAEGLSKLRAQDPTLRVQDGLQAGEFLIAGMGELHLEIVTARLRTEFGVEAMLGKPQVIYRPSLGAKGVVTLEPIMCAEITLPKDPAAIGSVGGNLLGRRGIQMEQTEDRGVTIVMKVRVPLASMLGYASDLRSRTQGRGTYTLTFDRYEPVSGGSDSERDRDSNVRAPLSPRPSPRSSAAELLEPDSL
jgi:translation elongation factor EF-G